MSVVEIAPRMCNNIYCFTLTSEKTPEFSRWGKEGTCLYPKVGAEPDCSDSRVCTRSTEPSYPATIRQMTTFLGICSCSLGFFSDNFFLSKGVEFTIIFLSFCFESHSLIWDFFPEIFLLNNNIHNKIVIESRMCHWPIPDWKKVCWSFTTVM